MLNIKLFIMILKRHIFSITLLSYKSYNARYALITLCHLTAMSGIIKYFFVRMLWFLLTSDMIDILCSIIDNSRTGLDTSKNQCSAPAVTALKNYWRYHVYNLFRLKNSSNVFAFIIIIIGSLTGNIIHDQLKLRPYFLPWVSKNIRYVSTIQSLFLIVLT